METILARMKVKEEFRLPWATCLTSGVGLFKLTGDFVIFGSGSSLSKGLYQEKGQIMLSKKLLV